MAHLRSRRKRKLKPEISIIELSDVELLDSSQEDSDGEVEKNVKIRHIDPSVASSKTNLESDTSCYIVENPIETIEIKDDLPSSQDLFDSPEPVSILVVSPEGSRDDEDCSGNLQKNVPNPLSLLSCDSDTLNNSLDIPVLSSQDVLTTPSQDVDFNTVFKNLNSEDGGHNLANIKQKLLELEERVQQLSDENENLRSKCCSCIKDSQTVSQGLVATVRFTTLDNYNTYGNNFITAFQSDLKFDVKENSSDLTIEVLNFSSGSDATQINWIVVDELPEKPKKSKHHKKKKKRKEKLEDELFVLDTIPNIQTKSSLHYESRFTVLSSTPSENTKNAKDMPSNCFNCNENHNLRDCPRPKNFQKINAARQKFKGNSYKLVRYHLEDDQRFAHLKAGIVSENLRQALGLRDDQLPAHIYKMRQLGYPPGWFEELHVAQSSSLLLFDFQGKNDFKPKAQANDVDPEKIVEYSGFNVPLAKGTKDEYKFHGCPQYSKEFSKHKMLDYARQLAMKAKDNLETCDMDVEEPSFIKANGGIVTHQHHREPSPTLNDLEYEKEKLLSELIDENDDSTVNSTLTQNESIVTIDKSLKTIDATGIPDAITSMVTNVHSVKKSSFGTPILSSLSPFSKLPKAENFQQDVSDVINFENLPNSTGMYEKMVGVLSKVRQQMKVINDS